MSITLSMGLLGVSVHQGFGGSVELMGVLIGRNNKARRNPAPQQEVMWV